MDDEEIYINDLQVKVMPNLNNLLEFMNTVEDQDNFNVTACYYFYKIVGALLVSDQEKFLSYIYTQQKFINLLINNSGIKTVSLILQKILNLTKDEENINLECKFLKHRLILYQKILKSIFIKSERDSEGLIEVFMNLYDEEEYIADAEYFLKILFQDEKVIKQIIQKILKQKSIQLIDLLIKVIQQNFNLKKSKDIRESEIQLESNLIESDLKNSNEKIQECLNNKKDSDVISEECQDNFKVEEIIKNYQTNVDQKIKKSKSSFDLKLQKNVQKLTTNKEKEEKVDKVFLTDNFENEKLRLSKSSEISDANSDKNDQQNKDEQKENVEIKPFTSLRNSKNCEIIEYNSNELECAEILEVLDQFLPQIKHEIFKEVKEISQLQSDGIRIKYSGHFKIKLMKLLDVIADIDQTSIKNILIEDNFCCQLLQQFLTYSRNNLLHIKVSSLIKKTIVYLTNTIDKASSEIQLENFLDSLYNDLFQEIKNIPKKTLLKKYQFIGFLNEISFFIENKLNEINCFFENVSWARYQNEYLNNVINTKGEYLVENPRIKKSMSISGVDKMNFFIKEQDLIDQQKRKQNKKSEEIEIELEDSNEFNDNSNKAFLLTDLINNLKQNSENFENWNEKFEDYEINQENIFSEEEEDDEIKLEDDLDKEINTLSISKQQELNDEGIIQKQLVNVSPLEEKDKNYFKDHKFWKSNYNFHNEESLLTEIKKNYDQQQF